MSNKGADKDFSFASTVHATTNPSICPSICLSVRHTPVLCQNEGTQRNADFTTR